MKRVFLHSVKTTGDIKDIDGSLVDLEKILATGAILTRHSQRLLGFGFNGTKHVSLSDYSKRFNNIYKDDPQFFDYTAYAMYSTKAVSIMIDPKKVKYIVPNLVKPLDISLLSALRMFGAANDMFSERISDLPDEVQVHGDICEDAFCGITIPVEDINSKFSVVKVKEVYLKIKELLKKYEYHLGIYDVGNLREITSERDIEEIVKRSH